MLHIRDFPTNLHKKLKGYAVEDDVTLQTLVVQMAEEYVQRREAQERRS